MPSNSTARRLVRGYYDGSVVVLEEPAPVAHSVEVTVAFPEPAEHPTPPPPHAFHWASALQSGTSSSATEELMHQRRLA